MEVELAQIDPELETEVREYATSRLIDAILTRKSWKGTQTLTGLRKKHCSILKKNTPSPKRRFPKFCTI